MMAKETLNESAVTNQVPQCDAKHKEVAEEIQLLHSACLELSRRAKSEAQAALAGALRAGTLLTEVKDQLPHGEWMPWLRKHLPGISHSTINRYIRVARRLRERGSPVIGNTLVDAYRAAGILPAKKRTVGNKSSDRSAEGGQIDAVRKSISSLSRALRQWKQKRGDGDDPSGVSKSLQSDLKRLRDEIDELLVEGDQEVK